MKKIVMMSAGLLICSGIVLANQYGVKSLNFGAPTVKDVDQVADAHDGDIVYQMPTTGPKTPGFWGRINGAWVELLGSQSTTPAGIISAYGGTAAPAGYLLCDGSSYNASAYPALAAALWDSTTGKYAYGGTGTYPDGTFNVPDLRGRFLRGVDGAAGRDPDSGSRSAMASGGNINNNIGSIQADMFASHVHETNMISGTATWGQGATRPGGGAAADGTGLIRLTSPTGGNESRPKNAYVNFIIKY